MENQQTTEKLPTSKAVIAYLAEQFPQCFSVAGEAKPLKIGIFEDLASRMEDDPKVSKTRLRGALRQYTNSWRYLRCVTAGTERVDLDGAAAGIVEEDHAKHAQEELAESKARAAEKRVEKRKAEHAAKEPGDKTTKSAAKRPAAKRAATAGKSRSNSKGKATAAKADIKLAPLADDAIKVGQSVQVKLGQSPMAGTVTAIEKSEVQVQLVSGITVKVKAENLFTES
ncbi:RNA chaperone ProQ [Aliidiomarina sedimenti]|uniref:RNA chaperone ProQ n=2 Tax=Aliidiomarina TaxID=1249554 RepID=A0A432WML9_9GAMM|nr:MULTISPECIES: RNA chaperone ProQ [Aliidiomarina]RUO31798.1 RNA chaperone ProQ [Aliidiomarina sedimenti]RUO34939.1 RNA chaperone ProQ [Aliidiomarina soli]